MAALSSNAELLILDEPTSGLDPLMEQVFQDVIGEAQGRGTSVLLSSHILSEAESLADRISIIRDGLIVRTGTLEALQGDTETVVHATLADGATAPTLRWLTGVTITGQQLTGFVTPKDLSQALAELSGLPLAALRLEPPSLESLFMEFYESESPAS